MLSMVSTTPPPIVIILQLFLSFGNYGKSSFTQSSITFISFYLDSKELSVRVTKSIITFLLHYNIPNVIMLLG